MTRVRDAAEAWLSGGVFMEGPRLPPSLIPSYETLRAALDAAKGAT